MFSFAKKLKVRFKLIFLKNSELQPGFAPMTVRETVGPPVKLQRLFTEPHYSYLVGHMRVKSRKYIIPLQTKHLLYVFISSKSNLLERGKPLVATADWQETIAFDKNDSIFYEILFNLSFIKDTFLRYS